MAHRVRLPAALIAVLSSCTGGASGGPPSDAAGESPGDAPSGPPGDGARSVVCAREGTSLVAGSGPAGGLEASHVYAYGEDGFCPDTLHLVLTTDDPLATPYLDGSGVIRAQLPHLSFGGATEWFGTFPATISLPDETMPASGTLQVDEATPAYFHPTRLRATARFDEGPWRFTATIDAPYCWVAVCI